MKRTGNSPLATRHFAALAALLLLTSCASTVEKLEGIGKPPALADVQNPVQKASYQPISWPLPKTEPPTRPYANSLWQPGARAFFRDMRASRVGDILRVRVMIKDKAELDNETKRERTQDDSLGAPSVFGLQDKILNWLPEKQNPDNLLEITGANSHEGKGEIGREEKIETQVAAIVTQVLPNGNLVIDGSQEIRVNFEVRQITVQGVVRPQDIDPNNTIDSSQIAEARISYGGRGQITDIQQPRWGSQVLEALSPF